MWGVLKSEYVKWKKIDSYAKIDSNFCMTNMNALK